MRGRTKPRPQEVITMSDKQWAEAALNERMLHVLRAQERQKVQEEPRGSNWGPKVSLFLKTAGIFTPAYWCAALITWALIEAGADRKKLPKFAASTYFWWKWAKDNDLITPTAKRGVLGVYNGKNGGHIWACLSAGEYHQTIEGNTNVDGSSNGYGVFERRRSANRMKDYPRYGFIEIPNRLFLD